MDDDQFERFNTINTDGKMKTVNQLLKKYETNPGVFKKKR